MTRRHESVKHITEDQLPEPFRTYWFGDRLERPYEFYLVDGELYIHDSNPDNPAGIMHHWTLDGCAGIGCFMNDEGILPRQDLPLVSTSGSRVFEVLYSDDYETSVRDPKTGKTTVVHSG